MFLKKDKKYLPSSLQVDIGFLERGVFCRTLIIESTLGVLCFFDNFSSINSKKRLLLLLWCWAYAQLAERSS